MKTAIIILSLICLFLFCYLILMKREIRNISRELKLNRQESYNKQIRVQLFDRDLTELTKECNYNLDYQTDCKRKAAHQKQTLKQAISDIAHDLRTPLTVVKGNLQLIKREGSLGAKEQQYLKVCATKTEELKYMIDEFFELSMLESDNSSVELTSVNITSLLLNVILEHEILIREHGLAPKLDLPEKTIFVQGNSALLERIFGNILGNIFKYAKEQFSVQLKEEDSYCIIEFSNPSSDIHNINVVHLFDRTYMTDASRQKPGTGLGLYIVKLLAEKQGAEVFAEIRKNELVIVIKLKKEI
ncbi:MAG: HAMP domain-containing histidine kinase [Lachnospiraceae bacterium]|nr:HAMP domain-containing histidine kinase [Lachnospiraceae bacterium]